jgi:hypothetical protein
MKRRSDRESLSGGEPVQIIYQLDSSASLRQEGMHNIADYYPARSSVLYIQYISIYE